MAFHVILFRILDCMGLPFACIPCRLASEQLQFFSSGICRDFISPDAVVLVVIIRGNSLAAGKRDYKSTGWPRSDSTPAQYTMTVCIGILYASSTL